MRSCMDGVYGIGSMPSKRIKTAFKLTAEKDGHRHIARAPDQESAVVHLGMLIGYPLDE